MITRILIFALTILLLTGCKSPKEKMTDVVLYQDSIGYWNYEWPREGAEYYACGDH